MKIYIDEEFKCHVATVDSLTEVETDFFDGKAPGYIEGYRFIPAGRSWQSEDGTIFTGEMIAPWKDWIELDALQRTYEQEQVVSLTAQNTELLSTIGEMVEEVYQSDLDVMEGDTDV